MTNFLRCLAAGGHRHIESSNNYQRVARASDGLMRKANFGLARFYITALLGKKVRARARASQLELAPLRASEGDSAAVFEDDDGEYMNSDDQQPGVEEEVQIPNSKSLPFDGRPSTPVVCILVEQATQKAVVDHWQLFKIMNEKSGWTREHSWRRNELWVTFKHWNNRRRCDSRARLPYPDLGIASKESLVSFAKTVNARQRQFVFDVLPCVIRSETNEVEVVRSFHKPAVSPPLRKTASYHV